MAISVVQRASGQSAATDSVSATFGSNVTLHNAIIAIVGVDNNITNIATPSDGTNTYTLVANLYQASMNVGFQVYIAYNAAATKPTVTSVPGFNDASIFIYEVAGLAASNVVNVIATQQITGTSCTSPTIATNHANELILGIFGTEDSSSFTYTVGSESSNIQTQALAGWSSAVEERIVSSTGSYASTAGGPSGQISQCAIVTFSDTATPSAVLLGSTFNTTSGTHTFTATPAVNDLIVIVRAATGNTTVTAPTDNNSSGTYTQITSALKNSSADLMEVYIRTALIGSASSTVFTEAPGTTTGGGLAVYSVKGMTKTGATASKQSGVQANHAASATPAPAFGGAATTTNVIIGAVFNATNPGGISPRSSPVYYQDSSLGYATPTAGLSLMSLNGGETGTTITWGSSSASQFSSIVVELDASGNATTFIAQPIKPILQAINRARSF